MADAARDPIVLLAAGAVLAFVLMLGAYVCLTSFAGDRAAIWIACFVVVFLLESIFRVREYSDKSIDLQIILKVVSWCYIFLFAVLNIPKYIDSLISAPPILWLLFVAWALYTASYSPNPSYSVIAVFSVAAFLLYFMSLGTERDGIEVVIAVSSAAATVAFVSIVVYFAVPQLGRMSEWQNGAYLPGRRLSGIIGTPNAMGEMTAIGLMLLTLRWQEIRRRLGSLLPFSFCLALGSALIMSNSRTAIASLALILGVNRMMRTRYLPWTVLFAIAAVLCVLLLIPYSEQVMMMVARSGEAAEIETGTARTQIWDTVIRLAEMKLWNGWGYASSVFVLPSYASYMGQAPPHAHNIVLQLWLTTGLIGVVLFLIAFSAQVLQSVLRRDALSLSLLGFVILNGAMEPGAFVGIANMSTIALAMAIARGCRRRLPPHFAYPIRAVAA